MRTIDPLRKEHVFNDYPEMNDYSREIHDFITDEIDSADCIRVLWRHLTEIMMAVPVFHSMELSVADNCITLCLHCDTKRGENNVTLVFGISDLLCEHPGLNHLAYDPAEGF